MVRKYPAHNSLRQTFALQNGLLIVCIHDYLPAEINFFSSSTSGFIALESALVKESHDINKKSSIRLNIIFLNDLDSYVALFNIYHIIMDGFSLMNFINELNKLIANEKIDIENADEYIWKIFREMNLQEINAQPNIMEYIKEITKFLLKQTIPLLIKIWFCSIWMFCQI